MPGEAYDHLMAVVVLGAIFVTAVVAVPSLSYVNLLYLDQQQLRNIALSAMKTILFDEGYPANWGSMHDTGQFVESDVKRFGLALLSDPSLYVLDMYKVQRLGSDPMGNLSYSRIKDLLKLDGYDFSIVMRPQFKVDRLVTRSALPAASATVTFKVNVSRNDGQPVPNAIVYGTIVYTNKGGGGGATSFITKAFNVEKKYTDALGRCSGSTTVTASSGTDITDLAIVFKVTVADRATLVISEQSNPNPNDVAKINVVGDTIIAKIDTSLPGSMDSRWICNIQEYNTETDTSINLYNRTDSGWGTPDLKKGGNTTWTRPFPGLSYSDPAILIFTIRTETEDKGGRTFVLLIGPYTLWNRGGIIESNPVPSSSGASVSVQRDVIIAGMAYVAELRLWKSS